jgi:xanthosine utilization system XapX-like protein
MTSRDFARVIGILFLAVGVLGFVPGLKSAPLPTAPHLAVDGGYGLLLGLFSVNWIHNLVHLCIGVAAWRSSHSISDSRKFARGLALLYGGLAVMGLIPPLNSTFGFIPLFGHNVWLHAATAAVAAYFGFGQRTEKMEIRERYRRAA